MSSVLCLPLAFAAALAGCEGVVVVVDDEVPASAVTGPLYCPQEDDGCPVGDGVPSPVIVDVDGGAGARESIVMEPVTIAAQRTTQARDP